MKRLLSVIAILMLVSSIGWAQNTTKVDRKGNLYVLNTGSNSIDVRCDRFELSVVEDSSSYFCWDACYPPWVSNSDDPLAIGPGDTSNAFYTVYSAALPGVSSIKYCFYVDNMPGDSGCFIFSFDENSPVDSMYGTVVINPTVGIEFIGATDKNEILDIHPNPAKNTAALNYSLKRNAKHGKLVVRNVLGSEVYTVDLKGTSGQVILPVDEFINGVYFCTMIVDNEVYETKRLVVNH